MAKDRKDKRFLRFLWGSIPWVAFVLLSIFIIVMVFQIREKKTKLEEEKKAAIKKEIPSVKVITLNLNPRQLEDKLNLPAEIEPYENLWLKSEAMGQILEVFVEEGQIVKKGQVLVRLDDRDYITTLARIEAGYNLAQTEYKRLSPLVKNNIAPESELDRLKAQIKDYEAQRESAKLALSRTRIQSPISGRINELKAKKGDQLAPGSPVAQILQFEQVKVVVGIPESDVAAVFDLEEADVIIEALNGRRVKGKKVFLSRQPGTLARLYDLELLVPNPNGRILPGMFARVEIVKRVFEDALTIPIYALINKGDEYIVYVEEDGKARVRTVKIGMLSGWEAHILSGLVPGEKIIIVGHRFLDEGQPVEVIKNVNDPKEIYES
jgi:RND family efflux transporter MFP subunit